MSYIIEYHEKVFKEDIPRLSGESRQKIKNAIEVRLITYPDKYGKPLRKSLKNYRKLRVGDYRVVFRIEGSRVKIFAIAHRSIVYSAIQIRI